MAEAVIALLLRGGPETLRYSAVARKAGVSRPWIYKQFGKDPAALLDFVVKLFGERFAEMETSHRTEDVAGWRAAILASTRKGLHDAAGAPWVMQVWFRYRHARNPLGEAIRDLERRHVDKLVADMPPRLRKRRDAVAFARFFDAARLGVFHLWIDPAGRHDEDAVVAWLGAMLDAFLDGVRM